MAVQQPSFELSMSRLARVIRETSPPPKPLLGYSWIPRFLQAPLVEMTKAIICGVDCDEVYPNIFVGDEGSARNKEFLKAAGITHVLNTAEGSRFGQVSTSRGYYADSGITYLGLDILDIPQIRIINFFEQGTKFIDSALNSGGKVLVHCLMGLSRSTTIVLAYLMKRKMMSAEDALRTVRKQREVRPNDGFLLQLIEFENSLNRERACT